MKKKTVTHGEILINHVVYFESKWRHIGVVTSLTSEPFGQRPNWD